MSQADIVIWLGAWVSSHSPVAIAWGLGVCACFEILALYLVNPNLAKSNFLVDYVTGKSTKEFKSFRVGVVRDYADRALTLAGLSFAGLAIILTDPSKFSATSMSLFGEATLFFILSYKMEVVALKKQIFFKIQDVMLNFGLICMALAVAELLYNYLSQYLGALIIVLLALVLILHIREFKVDFIAQKITKRKGNTKRQVA